MKSLLGVAVVVLGLALTASPAAAQYPAPYPPPGGPFCVPGACNPGFYAQNQCGAWFGPNYCLRPPFLPFNGVLPLLQPYPCAHKPAAAAPPAFCGPMARSPRDFFMYGQTMNDY